MKLGRIGWMRHMVSIDPDFETKAADVIDLYLSPPAHAAVFCVDEKTAIQPLERTDKMLPLSPGRAESHGFEYKCNGTLSLFVTLNTATGEGAGKTAARHTSAQCVAIRTDVLASQSEVREIHAICDNVSSNKTAAVDAFQANHTNVSMHFTPTYSSWLNQVESRFGRIQPDVIVRSIFTSTTDLHKKLMRAPVQQECQISKVEVRQSSRQIRYTHFVSAVCDPVQYRNMVADGIGVCFGWVLLRTRHQSLIERANQWLSRWWAG